MRDLVHLAVEENLDIIKAGLDPQKIAEVSLAYRVSLVQYLTWLDSKKITKIILSRREMLDEYFGIQINRDGLVECLPLLLPGYVPNIDMLPVFLMHLGPNVCVPFEGYELM